MKQLKSYIWNRISGKCFYVSTIERDSSAPSSPALRYMETIAWEYDWDTKKRGDIAVQENNGPAFKQHFSIYECLYTNIDFS